MSIRRLNRKIKTLAEKGQPGSVGRNISVRVHPDGRRREWHPRKGWRRLA
jgi:hypothetical protein